MKEQGTKCISLSIPRTALLNKGMNDFLFWNVTEAKKAISKGTWSHSTKSTFSIYLKQVLHPNFDILGRIEHGLLNFLFTTIRGCSLLEHEALKTTRTPQQSDCAQAQYNTIISRHRQKSTIYARSKGSEERTTWSIGTKFSEFKYVALLHSRRGRRSILYLNMITKCRERSKVFLMVLILERETQIA